MFKRYCAIGVVTVAVIAGALFAQPVHAADDTVIAVVNGDKIYKKDVMAALKKLPGVSAKDTDKVFPLVVDEIINEKLIDDATRAAKVEDSPEYKTQLDALKAQLAKQIYVDKYLHEKVSDKVVKEEYAKFKKENEGKEEVHARHLLVKTEEEAKQAIKELDDANDKAAKFQELVKQRSSDTASAANGGDLGWFAQEDMLPEFSKAAFALKPGTYTETPVQTRFGWHVIYLLERRPREVPPMDAVSDAIRKKLSQDAVKELIDSLRAKAQVKMYDMNGKPFDFGNGKDKAKAKDDSSAAPAPADDKADAPAPADDSKPADKSDDKKSDAKDSKDDESDLTK